MACGLLAAGSVVDLSCLLWSFYSVNFATCLLVRRVDGEHEIAPSEVNDGRTGFARPVDLSVELALASI